MPARKLNNPELAAAAGNVTDAAQHVHRAFSQKAPTKLPAVEAVAGKPVAREQAEAGSTL
jgi:hypothetical protein